MRSPFLVLPRDNTSCLVLLRDNTSCLALPRDNTSCLALLRCNTNNLVLQRYSNSCLKVTSAHLQLQCESLMAVMVVYNGRLLAAGTSV